MDNHFRQHRLPQQNTQSASEFQPPQYQEQTQPRGQVPEFRGSAPPPSAPLNLAPATTQNQIGLRYPTFFSYQHIPSGNYQPGVQYTHYIDYLHQLLTSKDNELDNRRENSSYMQSKLDTLQQNNNKLEQENQQIRDELELVKNNTVPKEQYTEATARCQLISEQNEKLLKENEVLSSAKAEGERLLHQNENNFLQEVNKLKEMINDEKVKSAEMTVAQDIIKNKQLELVALKNELQGKVEGNEAEVKILQENLSLAEESLKAKEKELKCALDKVKVLKGEKNDSEKCISNLQAQQQQFLINFQQLKTDIDQKVPHLEAENQQLKKATKKMEAMKKTSKIYKAQMDELNSNVEDLEEEKEGFMRQVVDLEEEKEGFMRQVVDLEKEKNELKGQVQELEEEKGVLTKTVDKLQEKNEVLSKNINDLKAAKVQLKKTVIQLKNDKQDLKRNAEDLQSQNQSQVETVENLKAEVDKLTKDTTSLNSDKKVLFQQKQTELREHMEASRQSKSALQTAKKNNEDLQAENYKLKQQLESAAERARFDNKKANEQSTKLQEKVDDLLDKNKRWAMKAEELERLNKEVENKLHETSLLLQKTKDRLASEKIVTLFQKEGLDKRDVKIHELEEKVDQLEKDIGLLAAAVENLAAEVSNYEAEIKRKNKTIEQLEKEKLELEASSKSSKTKKSEKRGSQKRLKYESTDDDDDDGSSNKKFSSDEEEDPCLAKYFRLIEEEAAAKSAQHPNVNIEAKPYLTEVAEELI